MTDSGAAIDAASLSFICFKRRGETPNIGHTVPIYRLRRTEKRTFIKAPYFNVRILLTVECRFDKLE
ncbi:hypothetical protein KP806_26910 [Paenibacillus sp. N4]|uniref:hypothetical protein n=1 Tax=Paenibacillus vietnamensis TaxID=2590547 RepID=UPI001CD06487|nr:hypothetical protein [Paenibacillus vietnamensis]MCA0758691.1 hypothetical protein [Paenibacillus vietnamensis]